jgi:hypothetical protein
MELKEIEALIASAQKQKTETSVGALRGELAQAKANRELTRAKVKAAEVELNNRIAARSRMEDDLCKVEALKEYLADKYLDAKRSLIELTHKADLSRAEAEITLDSIRKEEDLSTTGVAQLMDRLERTHLSDKVEYDRNVGMTAYLSECRSGVHLGYTRMAHELSSLVETRKAAAFTLERLRLRLQIIVYEFRALQHEINDQNVAEQTVFRRGFGALASSAKEFGCGYIIGLQLDAREDWKSRLIQARRDLAKMEGVPAPIAEEDEKGADEEDEPDHLDSRLYELVNGKRIAIYGGSDTRSTSQRLKEWLGSHGVKSLDWFRNDGNVDDWNQFEQSLNNGGRDVVLLQVGSVSHSRFDTTRELCRKRGVPVLACRRFSCAEVLRQLK